MAERQLKGIAASPGIAIGPVFRHQPAIAAPARDRLAESDVAGEMERLRQAVVAARAQINAARQAATARAGSQEAAIFDAHLLMLDDPALIGEAERRIRTEMVPAELAIEQTAAQLRQVFESLDDDYLRARAADVADVANQLSRALSTTEHGWSVAIPPGAIVVAEELLPSDTALLNPAQVGAIVTARGGPTAHVAILARALGLPAVTGVQDLLSQVRDGEPAAVDGSLGEVVLAPEPKTVNTFRQRAEAERQERARWEALRDLPAMTRDGVRVTLMANIGSPEEVSTALQAGAEGIGLFRTEFLFAERPALPNEEEQFEAYRQVAQRMENRPVVIRTLDVGGDKPIPGIEQAPEANPFLGVRGIRLTLRHPELFATQLRAILRAASFGNVWIMFPMVATIDEVRAGRAAVAAAAADLRAAGVSHRADIPIGIMVEIPAAAIAADRLAREVDFFSLGTNDLVQYTLAIDRTNQALGAGYDSTDLAVLRLVAATVDAADRADKQVAVCGELAGDPAAIPLLLGLGLRELSMSASGIPRAKELIRALSVARQRQDVRRRLKLAVPE